jgi:hypothetical protein
LTEKIYEGNKWMTVGTQIQKAAASVQSVASSMKTFALETQDPQAKQMFQQLAQTLTAHSARLEKKYIEQQEPQYKQ